jgi:hypothetical protein
MSLHGKIEINGQAIGWWQARRTTPELDPDGTAIYDCLVSTATFAEPRIESFRLRHRYDDGSLALAAAVLAAAQSFEPRKPILANRMHEGICPRCRDWKFIGHGPLCVDCYLGAEPEATQ